MSKKKKKTKIKKEQEKIHRVEKKIDNLTFTSIYTWLPKQILTFNSIAFYLHSTTTPAPVSPLTNEMMCKATKNKKKGNNKIDVVPTIPPTGLP